jgi:hypothetical protein
MKKINSYEEAIVIVAEALDEVVVAAGEVITAEVEQLKKELTQKDKAIDRAVEALVDSDGLEVYCPYWLIKRTKSTKCNGCIEERVYRNKSEESDEAIEISINKFIKCWRDYLTKPETKEETP